MNYFYGEISWGDGMPETDLVRNEEVAIRIPLIFKLFLLHLPSRSARFSLIRERSSAWAV